MSDPRPSSTTDTAELETIAPGTPGEGDGGGDFEALPGRPLRKRFGPLTYLLLGLLVACGAFYGGARYGQSNGTTSSTGGLAALASRLAGTSGTKIPGGASFTGRSFPGGSAKSVSSAPSGTGSGSFSFAGGGGISGTIKLVTGKDLYVEEATGTVVKVDTGTDTAITVSSASSVTKLHPGDSVTVLGTNKNGTVTASRITDAGSSTASGSKG